MSDEQPNGETKKRRPVRKAFARAVEINPETGKRKRGRVVEDERGRWWPVFVVWPGEYRDQIQMVWEHPYWQNPSLYFLDEESTERRPKDDGPSDGTPTGPVGLARQAAPAPEVNFDDEKLKEF